MATVIITITDKGKGLNLKIESDPAFPGPAAKDQTTTQAQQLGMFAMEAMAEACK
jgi:hypothetical protein